ncbi:Diacylglycerol kinase theta [Eumeta japonica]|uniref:Diacylglycerol kinase theta n=1 Tax=Eumeta variegata TaxID=151549 RepID=A0A4C1WQX4_EUMVA|nr:Diacylglycerol kinase theta [Eumeta japonica]
MVGRRSVQTGETLRRRTSTVRKNYDDHLLTYERYIRSADRPCEHEEFRFFILKCGTLKTNLTFHVKWTMRSALLNLNMKLKKNSLCQTEMLISQPVCNFIVHERCVAQVVTPCCGVAPSLIKNPVAHCWSEPTHHKRKFCTVCRKRLDEMPAVHCMICEYYVHGECADFAAADCKENATYAAGGESRHVHHWREGNLPPASKCAACRRACHSAECLTGYRCEWCGSTVRTAIRLFAV